MDAILYEDDGNNTIFSTFGVRKIRWTYWWIIKMLKEDRVLRSFKVGVDPIKRGADWIFTLIGWGHGVSGEYRVGDGELDRDYSSYRFALNLIN